MPQAAAIVFAALVLAGVVIWRDWPEDAATCPAKVEVIRYLYLVEPAPIYPAPQLMNVADYVSPAAEPEPEADAPKGEEEAEASPSPFRHARSRHRYHRRHWRRR